MAGVRKSVYVKSQDKWILNAVKTLLRECDEVGIRCTESDVVVSALREYLKKYRKAPTIGSKPKAIAEGLKKTVMCPINKAWLFDRINELVRLKQAVGVSTSFSYEICQLAISGLTSNQDYGKICRQTIKNFNDIQGK